MMSDVKQVKVDNWGIYFLQRLKHFFNRTDYCDLTLQFQDNAQLKVHRLVLNACTEYFELLERTCEMYEDCLVMPDDLQADVVVPIINFMYTGQLEFKMDSLEKLYQTSLVMNMPVLTKLLEAHRNMQAKVSASQNYSGVKKSIKHSSEALKSSKYSTTLLSASNKRSFTKAFENYKSYQKVPESNKSIVNSKTNENKMPNNSKIIYREKKYSVPKNKSSSGINNNGLRAPSPIPLDTELYTKKFVLGDPRPTRYELPEELDTDNIFENSFSKLSYTSAPLMVHPETSKQYSKKSHFFTEASGSKKGMKSSTVDIVECKKISQNDNLFEDETIHTTPDDEMFQSAFLSVREENNTDSNQLFDQMLDEGPKVTIEGKDKQSNKLDHAKIISEVLKKYPHLVKGNKNIKLKILNSTSKMKKLAVQIDEKLEQKPKSEVGYIYETDVLNSKEAANLIAMGAENIKGPWICLICGTPGRALNFSSYYNFRRHLVEVHNEKPVSTICEYCGLKSLKRNYLLHHIYTKHGVPPPPQYHFPKCNICDYVALTEAFLIKHKLSHNNSKTIRCFVCSVAFSTSQQLLHHIQKTGHHFMKDKKPNLQCVYCMKVFLRESNFYVHLKTSHRELAIREGIIEDSDEEREIEVKPKITNDLKSNIKYEQIFDNEYEDNDTEYQIQQKTDINLHAKKSRMSSSNTKHKILNPGFSTYSPKPAIKPKVTPNTHNEYVQDMNSPSPQANEEDVVLIDGNEYIMKDNQLIPKKTPENTEYILTELVNTETDPKVPNMEASITPTTPIAFTNLENTDATIQQSKMIVKKANNINQPIQIVVSNEEEYKALMSSNHSIIFDDGDTNKTLTVLTAPHTNSVDNTAIELQNTQPGDMMIIQQDYPLNVTETVSTVSADSKYVVVYSHAVGQEDPTKQYQIITPHEIGAQFVQASEVMTQNFETITTTTPVLDNRVIQAQIEESWPQHTTDVQAEELVDTSNKIDEVDTINDSIEQTDPNTSTDLPEVQLPSTAESIQSNSVIIEPISNNIIAANSVNIEDIQNNTNQIIIEEIPNNTTESMDVDISVNISGNQVNTEESVIDQIQPETITESSNISHEDHSMIQDSSVLIDCHVTEEIMEESKEMSDKDMEPGSTNVTEEAQTSSHLNTVEIDTTSDESVTVPKVVEEIQNITSEWSEDEYDLVTPAPIEEIKIPAAETETQITEESEIEESIENIQHEMQKQLSHIENEVPVAEENTNSTEVSSENPKDSDISNEKPKCSNQEKITSLLNDWEDNDSQEDNVSTNDSEVQASLIQDGDQVPVVIQNQANKDEPTYNTLTNSKSEVNGNDKNEAKKDNNIKSLVSDWDDDEEETKE